MSDLLAFWAVSLLVGLLAMPLAFVLLRRLPDAGAGLSFALGLMFVGYGYFMLRTLRVLPFGRGGYLLALALFALLALAVAGRDRRFVSTLRRSWPGWVIAAGVFTCFFFGYAAFRSYQPEINGTEQPMDFMYLNATLTSTTYPPKDPWLAGSPASYYYFGYLQVGVLTSASGVTPSTGYNLGLAFTFAAAAAGIVSLVFALARWALGSRSRRWAFAAAGVAVLFLLFLGSLSAVFELAAAHGAYNAGLFGKFGVEWLIPCKNGVTQDCFTGPLNPRTTSWYPTEYYFWWRGSRIIPNTITEFPFFSFLLGDLHPHVMSIPLVLLSLGVSGSVWRGRRFLSFATHRREPWIGVAVALIFGALAFENAWDILTFTAVLAVAIAARNLRVQWSRRSLLHAAGYLGPILVVAVAAYVPWYVDFRSQAAGLYPYVGAGTRPAHAFLQFGPLLFAGLLALTWAFRRGERTVFVNTGVLCLWAPFVPFALWVALAVYHGEISAALDARTASGWITLFLYAASAWSLLTAAGVLAVRRHAAALPVMLVGVGALLLYGSELFLIRDVFFNGTPRLNTVFKLSYQAWMLFSVGGAVALVVAARKAWAGRSLAGWLAAPAALICVAGLVYAITALPNRTEGFDKETNIDGLSALAHDDPAEYALTRWVQDNTAPDAVLIEGSGRAWVLGANQQPVISDAPDALNVDYTDAGSVASRTGRADPIGWYFHEIQWRGDTKANAAEFSQRQSLVDSVYTDQDPANVLSVMRRFGAQYLVVGSLEKAKYPATTMPDFASFLDVAFDSGGLRVYSLPVYSVVRTS